MGEAGRAARVSAGLHRAVLAEHLRALLAHTGVDLVLDAGAGRGDYGGLLRGVGYRGRVISFEPGEEAWSAARARAEGDAAWDVRRLALGARDGEAELRVAAHDDLSSLRETTAYARAQAGAALAEQRRERVPLARLDSVLAGTDVAGAARILLKVDVQGSEWDVLEGAGAWLERIVALQIELAVQPLYEGVEGWRDALGALEARGFALTGIVPVTRDEALRVVEVDCVMVRIT